MSAPTNNTPFAPHQPSAAPSTINPSVTIVIVDSTSIGNSLVPTTISITGTSAANFAFPTESLDGSSIASDLASALSADASAYRPSGTFTLTPSTLPTLSLASSQVKGPTASTEVPTVSTSATAGPRSIASSPSAVSASTATPASVTTSGAHNAAAQMGPNAVLIALPLFTLLVVGLRGSRR